MSFRFAFLAHAQKALSFFGLLLVIKNLLYSPRRDVHRRNLIRSELMIFIESAVGVRACKVRLVRAIAAMCVPALRALLTAVSGGHGNDKFAVLQRLVLGIGQRAAPRGLKLDGPVQTGLRRSSIVLRFARLIELRLGGGHHGLDFQIFKSDHIHVGKRDQGMRSLMCKVLPHIAPIRIRIIDLYACFAPTRAMQNLPRQLLLTLLDAFTLVTHSCLLSARKPESLRLRLQGRYDSSVTTDRTLQQLFRCLHSQARPDFVFRLRIAILIAGLGRTERHKEPASLRLDVNGIRHFEGAVRLENLPRIFADRIGVSENAAGGITLSADCLADLKHSRLEKLDGALKIEDLGCTWSAYTVQGAGGAKFSWRNGIAEIAYDGDLHTNIGGISYALKQFSLRNVLKRGSGVNGSCTVNVGGTPGGDFSGRFILRHNREGVMEFTLRPHEGKSAAQEIAFNGMKAAFPALKRSENYLKLAFTDDVHVSGLFQFPEIALTAGEFSASMKQFRLELGGTPLALQVGMTLPELALSAGGNIPPVVLGDISLQADLGGTKTSSFAVKGIRCDGHEIGKIAGTLQPDMRNGLYGLKAEIETLGVRSTLAASFLQSGRVFDASFRIPEQNLAKEIDLGTYVPALQSFVLASATFQADCVYRWTPEGHRGGAKLLLSKVNAVSEEKKFRLADASLRFTLPNLPELRSGAGQSFRFKALRFDNLNFDSANVLFRMESPTVWQLEGATFNWCGGKIRLGLRLSWLRRRPFGQREENNKGRA